jgi:cellulose synthase/poly-beta-1,6-N-acetylglucosamine synthase-like glycosyltransferase
MTWLWIAVFASVGACTAILLVMALYQLVLMVQYRRSRGPDPEPAKRFSPGDLPSVTVQLPVYNEGPLAAQCLRFATELDYPKDKLQLQFLDDSTDGITTRIALEAIGKSRLERPELDIQYIRREDRSGFKAGALRLGTSQASGELLAIFDADFLIPPDFLHRTVHFFTDPGVAAVQGRWSFIDRHRSTFSRLQANKLDSHQMFEQTARARWGRPPIFHGTAGVWRATALEEAGGWNCITEVEDVEISIRSAVTGRRIVYLDHLRVPSELPETVIVFLRQQMRWKRGWTRVALHYTGFIARSGLPKRVRLDLLQRIHLSWGPALALVMVLGVLPFFIAADRLGLKWLGVALYTASLALSLAARHLEEKTLREDPLRTEPPPAHPLMRVMPLGYLMGLGTAWALTQATFEGFRPGQIWEVTPKSGTTPGSEGHQPSGSGRVPGYVVGTLATGALGTVLAILSVVAGHYLAALFYLMLAVGCGWIGGASLGNLRPGWFSLRSA